MISSYFPLYHFTPHSKGKRPSLPTKSTSNFNFHFHILYLIKYSKPQAQQLCHYIYRTLNLTVASSKTNQT